MDLGKSASSHFRCSNEKENRLSSQQILWNPEEYTLLRNLKCNDENSSVELQLMGRKTILGAMVECELIKYLVEIEHRYFGLTRGDLMRCAYKICLKKGIPHPFNSEKKAAGRSWVDLFLRRPKTKISVRQTARTSKPRILGFQEEAADKFFSLVAKEYKTYNFPPHHILNCNETGINTVPSKFPKVI